uniref:Uncharacterized protein n=1 Tax=Rhizophora mucronata TaxID=61149 RepID=A0A2P2PHV8_RHIMU
MQDGKKFCNLFSTILQPVYLHDILNGSQRTRMGDIIGLSTCTLTSFS